MNKSFNMVSMDCPEELLRSLENEEQISEDIAKNLLHIATHYGFGSNDDLHFDTFVDSNFNFYTVFFKGNNFVCGYKYQDEDMEWTVRVDNQFYGNPLGIDYEKESKELEINLATKLFPDVDIETALLYYKDFDKEFQKQLRISIEKMFSNFTTVKDIPGEKFVNEIYPKIPTKYAVDGKEYTIGIDLGKNKN